MLRDMTKFQNNVYDKPQDSSLTKCVRGRKTSVPVIVLEGIRKIRSLQPINPYKELINTSFYESK
jgi:hypothetical protein